MAAPKASSVTVSYELTFAKVGETKGTWRYAESGPDPDNPKVGSLYVRRPAVEAMGNPETLVVTVSPA